MGRIGAKGKKPSVANKDDSASSDKEKVRAQRKRGRPQKSPKDDIDEEENSEDTTGVPNKDVKATNGKKLKRDAQVKDNVDSVDEEIGNGKNTSTEEESKNSNGFRQNGNRRKNKPRRAAEAVVECS